MTTPNLPPEQRLFDTLAQEAAKLGRKLTKQEWLGMVGPFIKSEVERAKVARRKAAVAEGAEKVYDVYPKHVGRDEALTAITKALKSHPLEYLLDKTNQFRLAVESWPSSYRYFQDGGDRCPHPATWFNQGRFQDDPKEWRRSGARGAGPSRPAKPTSNISEAEADEARQERQARFLSMPEPEEGTLEHSLWVEAHKTRAVESVALSVTETVLAVEQDQRLRQA